MSNVLITTSGLPEDYCFTTPQQYAIDLAAVLQGNFVYSTLFSTGNATPAVSLQNRPWFRYNSDGTPDGWYNFVSGNWISPYGGGWDPGDIIMWEGTAASVESKGGNTDPPGTAITATTGAFWEIATEFAARSPIAPGTLAGGTVINIGDNLGEDEHAITIPELPEHHHDVTGYYLASLSGGDSGAVLNDPTPGDDTQSEEFNTSDTGDAEPMSLLHPVRAVWMIRKTIRLYKRI